MRSESLQQTPRASSQLQINTITGVFYGIFLLLSSMEYTVSNAFSDDGLSRGSEGIRFPKYDGVTRVFQFGSLDIFERIIKKRQIVVVLFTLPKTDDPVSVRTWNINDYMLEVTAQVMQNRDVTIGYVDILENPDIAANEGVKRDGAIHVYRGGRRLVFYGHRSPEVLIAFLLKLFGKPVTILESKSQKKNFDNAEPPKVIGYFQEKNTGYKALEETAKNFQPNIPFYAVFDKKIARQLKLKTFGTIHFYKPYETHVKTVPSNPAISSEIINFISANRRPILKRLSHDDVHSTWMNHPHSHLIIAFIRPQTEDGMAFFTLLKKLARANGENENISIVWIDPGPYPTMLEYWQRTYGIDVLQSSIGLVNITDNKSKWFNMPLLYQLQESERLSLLQKWLDDIEEGRITVSREEHYEDDMNEYNSRVSVNQTNTHHIEEKNIRLQTGRSVESGVRDEL
ncbi:calsequestrin-1-like [Lineus longissimus]|uniref:calsequestrin-1-like n=1 Tax=Lineus longissimus TaxID=88925 RepID=UPI00315D7211